MIFWRKIEPWLLVCLMAISRFATRSHDLYDLDSVNFALGMERFDPGVHQPHPPGYFLYVEVGRLLTWILHDANLALVILSIAASCGTIFVIYKMAEEWFGLSEARFASLLFLCSPLGWFHGIVALTYSVEAFFSAVVGFVCWKVNSGERALILPASIILGVSTGIRPSSLLFLGPLYLYSLWKAGPKSKLAGVAALGATLAAWGLPMIWASGGFRAYFGALASLWGLVPSRNTVFNSSPATSIARACTIVFIYLLSFGAGSLALFAAGKNRTSDPEKRRFTIVWVTPALCFFTFVFLQFVNSGYVLLLAAPACIWLGLWASLWYRDCRWRRPLRLAAIWAGVAVNLLIFFRSPFYFSYRSVRGFEAQLEAVRSALPGLGSADDTVIVSFDSHFLGYRHAGYYFPDYLTVEYPEVKLRAGTRVFAMQHRDTRLVAELPVGAYSRFLLFPLPGGDDSYGRYLESVKRRLPDDRLRTVHAGGHNFVTGPIALLPLLFPNSVKEDDNGVYPPLHSETSDVNRREHPLGAVEP
jgi:hypothetical protein